MVTKALRLVITFLCVISISCTLKKKVADEDFGADDMTVEDVASGDSADEGLSLEDEVVSSEQTGNDEFADFDNANSANESATASNQAAPEEPASENNQVEVAEQPQQNQVEEPPVVDTAQTPLDFTPSEPVAENPAVEQQPSVDVAVGPAQIKDLKFMANDNGGTLVINSDRPLTYTTRMNSSTNQLVVEVQNAIVPNRLKRPLNTKDMTSTIGSIDIYQNRNSNVARFVVQLRQGAAEPLVQPEGNSLLVLGTPNASGQSLANGGGEEYSEEEIGLMSSTSIDDFLLNNNKFYGRKISIETTDMDIRDILKFISEESGINMVFDENITGKMSLKLRKIPWDQALITVLKSKKLGFRRQGQVLRIASIETLLDEEETAVRIKEGRLRLEPLVVKNFHINYTNISNLEQKVRDFIKEADQVVENEGQNGGGGRNPTVVNNTRGKVTADAMTNTLIVTDTPTNLARVEKLIQLLDVQPQQVLIEGRVIEASESYSRAIGVNFGLNTGSLGADNPLTIPGSTRAVTNLGNTRGSKNPINISPSATFTPAVTGALSASMWLGRFGAFGDLATRLALDETENKVKILSSPRIAVLHNNSATIKQGSIIQVPDTSSQGTGTGTVTQTFKDVEVGVNLSVKPLITNVGTVNLDLSIEKSAVAGAGERTSRNAKTNIIVKNGETAVIGGVFTSDVNTTRSGIPGLKDIPVLGTLFRTDGDSKGKTELMFFISPQILPSLDVPLMKASGEDEPGSVN